MQHQPMDPIYIRTDRNGTKIYHDYNCPRCAGYGMLDKWINTGRTCYACGGSGKRTRPKVVKEYTPEYWAKLDAKHREKARKEAEKEAAEREKYEAEHAEEIAQRKAEEIEWRRQYLARRFAEYGCDQNGIGYVLMGKTYPVKDQIKEAGGQWLFGVWICPVSLELKGVRAVRIDISHAFDDNDVDTPYDVIMNAKEGY